MSARNENLRKLERMNVTLTEYHRWLGHEFPAVERVLENLFIELNSRPIGGGDDVGSFRSVSNLREELRAMTATCGYCGLPEHKGKPCKSSTAASGVPVLGEPDNIRAFLHALQARNEKDNGLFPQVASEVEADAKALRRVLAVLDFYHPPRTLGVSASDGEPLCTKDAHKDQP